VNSSQKGFLRAPRLGAIPAPRVRFNVDHKDALKCGSFPRRLSGTIVDDQPFVQDRRIVVQAAPIPSRCTGHYEMSLRVPTALAQEAREVARCDFCHGPLFEGQPMTVPNCAKRTARGSEHSCRPDASCSSAGRALHVACALHLRRA
jgi:hypothetical protein